MISGAEVHKEPQPSMCWELTRSVFVIAHSNQVPSDADYDAALRGYAEHLGEFKGILVSTTGGGPNFAQRKRTTQFWEGKDVPPTVVMTSSPIVRGIIKALNWFLSNSQIVGVPSGDFPRAFDYLNVPAEDHAHIEATVQRLHRRLKG